MKWFRNLLKGASLTTALFIFQACYGTPAWLSETEVSFKVVSAEDNSPIKDVEVFTRVYNSDLVMGVDLDWNLCGYTEEDGTLDALVGIKEGNDPEFRFKDKEEVYEMKDTVIENLGGVVLVKLQKK